MDFLSTQVAKRASDVMTQTRHKQTGMLDDFEDLFKGKSRWFLKHLWNENLAYIPCISLRTRLCWPSLAENSVICILSLNFVLIAIESGSN